MGHALPNCPGSGIQENHGHCPCFANAATKLSVFQLYRTVQVMIIFSQLHAESVEQNNSVNLRQLVETPETWHSLVTGMDGNLALELQGKHSCGNNRLFVSYLCRRLLSQGTIPNNSAFSVKMDGRCAKFSLGKSTFLSYLPLVSP